MTEGSPGHLFPLDTLEAVANEQERATELEVLALECLEYDVPYFLRRVHAEARTSTMTMSLHPRILQLKQYLVTMQYMVSEFLWILPETCRETWF
jgi:hypothetical protein